MDTTVTDLARRVEHLERQNRRLLRWGGAALLAVTTLAAFGMTAAQDVPEVLKARRIQVVDSKGTVRVDLGANDGPQGAYILVSNARKETRFALATGDALGSMLTMYGRGDGSLSPGVMMQARPGEGMPILAVVSPLSSASAEMTFEAPDVPKFALSDGKRKEVFAAVGASGPRLTLASPRSSARLDLDIDDEERPQITVSDRKGKVLFKAAK